VRRGREKVFVEPSQKVLVILAAKATVVEDGVDGIFPCLRKYMYTGASRQNLFWVKSIAIGERICAVNCGLATNENKHYFLPSPGVRFPVGACSCCAIQIREGDQESVFPDRYDIDCLRSSVSQQ